MGFEVGGIIFISSVCIFVTSSGHVDYFCYFCVWYASWGERKNVWVRLCMTQMDRGEWVDLKGMHPGPCLEFGDRSGGWELCVEERTRWVTQLDPREECADSAWVERLDVPWDGPVGLGLEQAGQWLWEDWRLKTPSIKILFTRWSHNILKHCPQLRAKFSNR